MMVGESQFEYMNQYPNYKFDWLKEREATLFEKSYHEVLIEAEIIQGKSVMAMENNKMQ